MRLPGDNTLRVTGFAGFAVFAVGLGLILGGIDGPGWALTAAGFLVHLVCACAAVVRELRDPAGLPPGDALLARALTWRARLQLRKFRGDPPCSHREDSHA